jgi:hypothetical protein
MTKALKNTAITALLWLASILVVSSSWAFDANDVWFRDIQAPPPEVLNALNRQAIPQQFQGCQAAACRMVAAEAGTPYTGPDPLPPDRRNILGVAEQLQTDGIDSNLHVPSEPGASQLGHLVDDVTAPGRRPAVIVGLSPFHDPQRPGAGDVTGHAVVVDGTWTDPATGREYFVVRDSGVAAVDNLNDPLLGRHQGGVYLKPKRTADWSVRHVLEPLPKGPYGAPNPRLNPNLRPNRLAGANLPQLAGVKGAQIADDAVRAGTTADDAARAAARAKDMADTADKLDELADAGKGRSALGKAVGALEAIGKIADTAEGAIAAAQLADLFRQINKASDPELSPEERNSLLDKIRQAANDLRDSAAVGAIMQRHPAVAVIYGAWTVGCLAGEFRSASTEASGGCLDRHISAWDRANEDIESWWTGNPTAREANARSLCNKFMAAVRQKRVRLKGDFTVLDACNAIKRGDTISDMIETAAVSPDDVTEDPPKPEVSLLPPTCDPAENQAIIANLRQAANDGSEVAQGHLARIEGANAQVAGAKASYESAKQAYDAGDLAAARASLNAAQASIDGLGAGAPDCPDLRGKIAGGLERADRLERILSEARAAVSGCDPAAVQAVEQSYGSLDHPALTPLLAQGDAIVQANAVYEDAKIAYSGGNLGSAESSLHRARGALSRAGGSVCPDLRQRVEDGLGRIERLRDAIRSAEQAAASCNASTVERWSTSLAKVSNPAANPVKAKLKRARTECEAKAVAERNATCERKHGRGYYAGEPDAGGTFYCIPNRSAADAWCNANNSGSGWKASKINAKGGFGCDRSAKQQQAENSASCRKQYGAGYYAGKPRKDGTYFCLPTKKTANAKCRQINGPGAIAGRIKPDGSHDCQWSGKARTQQAWADCRRQFGNALANVKIFKNGTYQCIYNTARRQPQHDPRSSAAAAAAAGAIIQGIIGAATNRDRGRQPSSGGHQPPPTVYTPPRTRGSGRSDHCKNMSIAAPTCS